MKPVKSYQSIAKNLATLDAYRASQVAEERAAYLGFVKLGTCFLAYEVGEEVRFAPSRFVGYENNALTKHLQS
jgi:hypothetical protein